MAYRRVDHTADVALELSGATLAEVLQSCIEGLAALWLDDGPVPESSEVADVWELWAPSAQLLLVSLANEAIYRLDVNGVLVTTICCDVHVGLDGVGCVAKVGGFQVSKVPGFAPAVQLKAATHGGLNLQQDQTGWFCRMILDT